MEGPLDAVGAGGGPEVAHEVMAREPHPVQAVCFSRAPSALRSTAGTEK